MAIAATGVIFITAVFCGIVALALYHFKRLNLYLTANKVNGPPAMPILGNALYFAGDSADILNKIMKLYVNYPAPFRAWLGSRLFVALDDPEQMKRIFTSQKAIEKEDLYKFIRPWVGTGLFTAPAAKWRVHRKLIAPTFNQRILETFVEIFSKQSEIMTTLMRKELNGGEVDIFHYVSLCTLDIICETAMGVPIKAQMGGQTRYVNSAKRVFEIVFERMFNIWLHSDFIFNRSNPGKDMRECVKYLHETTNQVIQQRKIAFNNMIQQEKEHNTHDRRNTKKAFLDLLIELSDGGEKLTDEQLREEVDTMMIAGNDTTATMNMFTLYMLANFPDMQERAYQELCEIYGDEVSSDRPIVNEDLHRMEYLERIIKESLRLFPIGPILVRQLTDDIDIGPCTLPKGCSVILGIMALHRSPKTWPDPLTFNPDRFLPEEVAKRHPYSFVPFSAGPRNCIGMKYAMMAMKVLIATILRRFILIQDNIVKIEDIELKADVMLKTKKTLTIRIAERS